VLLAKAAKKLKKPFLASVSLAFAGHISVRD
jgi:hypothetical protein